MEISRQHGYTSGHSIANCHKLVSHLGNMPAWKMPNGHCFELYVPGVDTDSLKGGAGNNHVQSTCENF